MPRHQLATEVAAQNLKSRLIFIAQLFSQIQSSYVGGDDQFSRLITAGERAALNSISDLSFAFNLTSRIIPRPPQMVAVQPLASHHSAPQNEKPRNRSQKTTSGGTTRSTQGGAL